MRLLPASRRIFRRPSTRSGHSYKEWHSSCRNSPSYQKHRVEKWTPDLGFSFGGGFGAHSAPRQTEHFVIPGEQNFSSL